MPLSRNLGTVTSWNPLGPSGPVTGLPYFARTSGRSLGPLKKQRFFKNRIALDRKALSLLNYSPKHRVKFIRTFVYIDVKLMAQRPGRGRTKYAV